MTKFLSGILILVCTSLCFLQQTQAQDPDPADCPITGIYNNSEYIAIVAPEMVPGWVNGSYALQLFTTEIPCFIDNQVVPFFSTTNMSNYIPEAPAGQAIIIDIRNTPCAGLLTLNVLQTNGTSIYGVRPSDGLPFMTLNFTENKADECKLIALPSTFYTFTATHQSNNVKLQWTTANESLMGHYSIEKTTFAPGTSWVKIGEVTAGNLPNASYTWYDYSPLKDAYYRIVSVDLNCYKVYSRTVRAQCASCPTGTISPAGPADCVSPNTGPNVTGPDALCNTTWKMYRLNNVSGKATTTWSISPSNLATLHSVGRMVRVTPTGASGIGTLTATVVKNGITSSYQKLITFGTPELTVSQSVVNMYDMGEGVVYWEVTPHLFPNTNTSQYTWYQNSTYLGNPYYFSWYLMPQQTASVEIRYNGPCGQSVFTDSYTNPYTYGNGGGGGGGGGGNPGGPGGPGETTWSVTPNPSTAGMVSVLIKTPASADRLRTTDRFLKPNTGPVTFKLFDKYGNLRKTVNATPTSNRFNISARELPPGLYYLHVVQQGRKTVVLKAWLNQ